MDLGEAGRIVASDPGGSDAELQITVRPEKIKLEPVPGDSCHVDGTVAEVVYLGSTTQMIVELPTGERLAVHRLNDDTAGPDPGGGDRVTLHWGCEHSFVVGSRAAAPVAEGATIA
jgi:ABC-type Fe3+/spermidine/putrescine transport system ATPase subunit